MGLEPVFVPFQKKKLTILLFQSKLGIQFKKLSKKTQKLFIIAALDHPVVQRTFRLLAHAELKLSILPV